MVEYFDERKKSILVLLSKTLTPITGKQLSRELNISLRTLQAEIATINQTQTYILSSYKGYQLNKDALETNPLLFQVESEEDHTLLRYLILKDEPHQIDELAESLYMSTLCLERKLKISADKLKTFDLTIKRSNAHVWIAGSELNKRRMIRKMILEETQPDFHDLDHIAVYFQGTDVSRIRQIVLNAIHKYGYFSETTYATNMIINIVIALYRMRSDSYMTSIENTENEKTIEYQIANEICTQYAMHWPIAPTPHDIAYIASLLTGQIKPEASSVCFLGNTEAISPQFLEDMRQILQETFSYYMLEIDVSKFLYNFSLHIDALLKRAKNQQSVNNNTLDNIRKNCPFIYDVAVLIANKIATRYKISISDEEIGYISIHVGFVIEIASQDNDKLHVLLLCDEYHQIAQHIKEKLMQDYTDKIVIYEDVSLLNNYKHRVDLIISTKELAVIGKQAVTITPFYSQHDKQKVEYALQQCLQEKEGKQQKKLLRSVFHEKLFFKTDEYQDKHSVIRFMADNIVNLNFADDSFTDSVLKREAMSSTCFFDTFAIPHAIEMNAQKTMLCVLLSEKGILWDNIKIHIVLMIAVQQKDRKKFMKIYSTIIQALWDKEKAAKLLKSQTLQEFMEKLL